MKIKRLMFLLVMLTMLVVLVSCKEATVDSTIRIENSEGKGTLTLDVNVDYSDGTDVYIVNGTEGIKSAIEKVMQSLNVTANVTFAEETKTDDAGNEYIFAHVYVEMPFNNIAEYNQLVKTLSARDDLPAAQLFYSEEDGGWIFMEHSTIITAIVANLRVLVCADTTAINLSPEGHDSHTADEACNSFYHYIYVGDGESDKFPIKEYRGAAGHQDMASIGAFPNEAVPTPTPTPTPVVTTAEATVTTVAPTTTAAVTTTADAESESSSTGIIIAVIAAVVVVAVVVVVIASKKKKS